MKKMYDQQLPQHHFCGDNLHEIRPMEPSPVHSIGPHYVPQNENLDDIFQDLNFSRTTEDVFDSDQMDTNTDVKFFYV